MTKTDTIGRVTRVRLRKALVWLLAAIVLAACGWTGYLQYGQHAAFGHFATLGLHADAVVHRASIGIPGITKMYEARLTNLGPLPVRVERCTFVSDTMEPGVSDTMEPGVIVAYNMERWDSEARAWKRTHEFAKPGFCTPVPLSMGMTRWRRAWLWPGQSLSTGEEATGARTPFRKGDTLRFVVVTGVTGTGASAGYPTPGFTLDEDMLDRETGYRVRH